MKCPDCRRNQKKKEGMTCTCGYRFTFNPGEDGIADGKFRAVLRQASANGTHYFTLNQLYATYCRTIRVGPAVPKVTAIIGAVVLAIGIAGVADVGPAQGAFGGFCIVAGLALTIVPLAHYFSRQPKPFKTFAAMVQRWRSHGKDMGMLIEAPALHEPPPNWTEADIYDYGAERIVIVERDILVDWLVLNGFHTQERALVISEKGYPPYLVPRMESILAQQPDVPVYVLHDASPSGAGMHNRIAQRLPNHTVIDLGIHSTDVPRIKKLRGIDPQRADTGIPVDCLPYMMLTGGMALAMAQQTTLSELLTRPVQDEGATGSFG